jgi:type I restriction enzyme M protein
MLQLQLNTGHSVDYFDQFRKLYYYLYTNSNASRAERIIGDLSKILLLGLCKNEKPSYINAIDDFLAEENTANELLLPILIEQYPQSLGRDDKFFLDDNSLRHGYASIAGLDLKGAKSHLLGDAFQALIGPNLRGDKGQFFTPKSIVRCMVAILAPKPLSKVVDPACGTAGFLTETSSFWEQNNQAPGSLIGIDKDSDLHMLSTALLEATNFGHGVVHNLNSLDLDVLNRLDEHVSPFNADYVLTNPPFGAKIPIKDKRILAQYDLGHIWEFDKNTGKWIKTCQLRDSQDPQILFVELCIRLLKDAGEMAIVLPEGVFGNSSTAYVLEYIYGQGDIFALIDCPRTSFQPGTDTKTNILFFRRAKTDNHTTRIAVALHCGHDRRGRPRRNDGTPYPDDFHNISLDWTSPLPEYWFDVKIRDPFYIVPRYYDRKTEILLSTDAQALHAKVYTVGDLVKRKWISIKKGHEVGSEAYGSGEIPFVRTSDISNFEVSIDPTKSVSKETYVQFKKEQGLVAGSILMVVDGRYRIGRCAILHEFNAMCIAQSHLRIITVQKGAPFTPFELLYLFSLPSVQRDIRSLVFIQSTLGSLGKRIHEIKLPVPQGNNEIFRRNVEQFEMALRERARLLAELTMLDHTEIEL